MCAFFYQGAEMMSGPQPGMVTPFVADLVQFAFILFAVLSGAAVVHFAPKFVRAVLAYEAYEEKRKREKRNGHHD
jgi:hypothetical protein